VGAAADAANGKAEGTAAGAAEGKVEGKAGRGVRAQRRLGLGAKGAHDRMRHWRRCGRWAAHRSGRWRHDGPTGLVEESGQCMEAGGIGAVA
jgi:hypothetical protein